MADQVEFVKLVERMRKLQREYFVGRSKAVLEQAKLAEMKVDRWLERYDVERVQYRLFGRNTKEHEPPAPYEVGDPEDEK